MTVALHQRLARLERTRPTPTPADDDRAALDRSFRAAMAIVGDFNVILAIGERVARGTTTDDDRATLDALRPRCEGRTPEDLTRFFYKIDSMF